LQFSDIRLFGRGFARLHKLKTANRLATEEIQTAILAPVTAFFSKRACKKIRKGRLLMFVSSQKKDCPEKTKKKQ
jgi:hypothetical protein